MCNMPKILALELSLEWNTATKHVYMYFDRFMKRLSLNKQVQEMCVCVCVDGLFSLELYKQRKWLELLRNMELYRKIDSLRRYISYRIFQIGKINVVKFCLFVFLAIDCVMWLLWSEKWQHAPFSNRESQIDVVQTKRIQKPSDTMMPWNPLVDIFY